MDKKISVLLVDDEIDFTQPMSFWLQSKGYSVIVASDGRKAVEIVKKDSPDVVFMDLNMPGGDGVSAVKDIRAFDKEIPVIIISAYLDNERVREVGPYGISGVFYKGADFKEGLALLESALRTHKKLRDLKK
ncbi:MAG: response regulator [Candidatus Omnitrophica bacterium]|nr:response regulator [Candidatus Omnitrophota bacterium]